MQVRKVLYPFSLLYGCITSVRNTLFDWEVLPSNSYDLPLIGIGNITVGGTGKTPLTEYLIRLLQQEYHLALLSRGYRRNTKGPLLADSTHTPSDIGDEPFQVQKKFPGIDVVVAEKRAVGMDIILSQTKADVVLMDDAYQHRYVAPGMSILVIDYNRPLWDDLPFPAGDLRETKSGQKRADIILVNKCPASMGEEEKEKWIKKLKLKAGQQVFFSAISYGSPLDAEGSALTVEGKPLLALAGIAKPAPFLSYLRLGWKVADEMVFADHHAFTQKDIENIKIGLHALGPESLLITTEKDFVRLAGHDEEIDDKLVYVPIQLKILFEQEKTLELIIHNYVRDYQKNS